MHARLAATADVRGRHDGRAEPPCWSPHRPPVPALAVARSSAESVRRSSRHAVRPPRPDERNTSDAEQPAAMVTRMGLIWSRALDRGRRLRCTPCGPVPVVPSSSCPASAPTPARGTPCSLGSRRSAKSSGSICLGSDGPRCPPAMTRSPPSPTRSKRTCAPRTSGGADLVGSSMGARLVSEMARRGVGRSVVALDPGGFWSPAQKKVFGATLAASVALVRTLRPVLPALLAMSVGRTALLSPVVGTAVGRRPRRRPPRAAGPG